MRAAFAARVYAAPPPMPKPMRDDATPADGALLLAFFLSGAAALGYELLWTRLLGFALGSETVGMLATLAGFFGGMALGAALLHRRAEVSPDPVRLFIVLELVAAGFALVSPYLLHMLAREVPPLLGPLLGAGDTSVALLASLLVATLALLPGTICLGATLAALATARRRAFRGEADGRGLGRLYAANTAGATAGVLLTVYWVLPSFGYALGAAVPAALGVAAAACARRWAVGIDLSPRTAEPAPPDSSTLAGSDLSPRTAEPAPPDSSTLADSDLSPRTAEPAPPDMSTQTAVAVDRDPDGELLREPWLLYLVTFGTGLAGVGLEVVGVQVLAQNLENTVYTFANILAVYLVGTALGAAIYQRHAARALAGRPGGVTLALLASLGALVVPVAFALQASPTLLAALAPAHADLGRAILGELGVAALVFLAPTMVMGALFAHVTGLIAAAGRGVGRGYALNTLGGALAPFLFGLWAIPSLGYADALYVVLYAYLAVFAVFGWFRRFHPALLVGGVLMMIALTAAGPRSLALLTDDPGWTTLDRRETLHGLVLVRERPDPTRKRPDGQPTPLRRLQVGHHFRMGGALSFGEQRMGQLCAMIAATSNEQPGHSVQRALFLGLGTGATMGAALDVLPEVRADGVELVPEVLGLLHRFADINHDLHKHPRATLFPADARRFVVASPDLHDLVLADLFHPGQDGAGSLYAEEHFLAVREHLRPGAPFCQWLPLHQLGPAELRGVVRTFLGVFPETHAFLGLYNPSTPALALIGRVPTAGAPQLRLDLARLQPLTRQPGVTIVDPRDLLASYMADGTALTIWAGEGPINTDLRPRILFDAPAAAYADDAELGARNLESLLALRPADPGALLTGPGAEALREPARRHAEAATLYLRAELARGQISDLKQLPPASAELAVQAYEADPEFAPARGSLYAIVRANPQLAELVLPRMLARTPDEPRVHQALLAHLQAIGDRARFDAALQAAQARFPQPANP
jgi:spermidine synthase